MPHKESHNLKKQKKDKTHTTFFFRTTKPAIQMQHSMPKTKWNSDVNPSTEKCIKIIKFLTHLLLPFVLLENIAIVPGKRNEHGWLAGKWTELEDVFPIENGDFPASHVRLPECICPWNKHPLDHTAIFRLQGWGSFKKGGIFECLVFP